MEVTCNGNGVQHRTDYIDWDDFFMSTAVLASMRSKDPITQVGACIVNEEKKILGIGYNGMPNRCSDDEFPWSKGGDLLEKKQLYVCHAEMNAIVNKNTASLKDSTIYVALFPCNECAKLIIQSGIKEVIYLSDKKHDKIKTRAAKRMFDASGIIYRQYSPRQQKIVINLDVS